MKRATITPRQLEEIQFAAKGCFGDLENYLLEKYDVFLLSELKYTDWDKIEEDMVEYMRKN